MFNTTYQIFTFLADTHGWRYSPREWKGEGRRGSIVGTFKGSPDFGREETYTVWNTTSLSGAKRLEAVCDQDRTIRTVLWEDGRTDYYTNQGVATFLAGER